MLPVDPRIVDQNDCSLPRVWYSLNKSSLQERGAGLRNTDIVGGVIDRPGIDPGNAFQLGKPEDFVRCQRGGDKTVPHGIDGDAGRPNKIGIGHMDDRMVMLNPVGRGIPRNVVHIPSQQSKVREFLSQKRLKLRMESCTLF